MSIAGKDGLPFYAITPWVVLFAVLGLVIHRIRTIMFGQVQRKVFTNRIICHSPKWVNCDGIHLAIGDAFCLSRLHVVPVYGVVGIETITSAMIQ
jgi:hypothetical protein